MNQSRPAWFALSVAVLAVAGCPSDDEDPPVVEGPWRLALEVDQASGVLLSVWGDSEDDVRAVGGQIQMLGEDGVGVMLRREGDAWMPEALPADTPLLNWIHGADGAVWAVGNAGGALRLQGGSWTADNAATDVPLWGVFVVSASDAWAVGGNTFDSDGTGVIFHHTGGGWQPVEIPPLDRMAPAFFKVWASGPSDVHVVGDNGVILHYDGSAWAQVLSGTGSDLISLWGSGPDEILAVGGRSNGVIVRYDGSGWTPTMLAMAPGLNGVWMNSDGVSILVGSRNAVFEVPAGSDEAEMLEGPVRLDALHAAFGFDGGPQFSVGGTLESPPPYTGVILERP